MSETFLSRWSRRKRAASIPPPERRPSAAVSCDKNADAERRLCEASGGEGGERSEPGGLLAATHASIGKREEPPAPDPSPPRASRVGGGEAQSTEVEVPAFDPATLPPIESIDAGTDVSAFLRPGVPADLAQAALRRAWVADPAIRDFVGLAENAWDFNAPGGVPGFEPLRAIDDVQRLAAQIVGAIPAAAPETAAAEQTEPTAAPESPQRSPLPAPPDVAAASPADAATQKDASPEERVAPRPRHGGALAE